MQGSLDGQCSTDLPFVTVVIPTRNEERTIERCLDSVLAQDYPPDRLEVLVLDGDSTDDTRAIVERVAHRALSPVRLHRNPECIIPAALNRAVELATGEFLVRVDGHSFPAPGYVRGAVMGNLDHGADLAGGWVDAVGEGAVGRAVAAALCSPFGTGNAMIWRRPDGPVEVESVNCGSYRLSALKAIGGFDEKLRANEDFEANYRLRCSGGKLVMLPNIYHRYVARDSFPRLARQFFRYGYYKARVMLKHPRSTRPRHLVPALGLATALAAAAAATWWTPAALYLGVGAGGYLLLLFVATARAARAHGRAALLLGAAFAIMHIAWAGGNLAGLVRWLPVVRGGSLATAPSRRPRKPRRPRVPLPILTAGGLGSSLVLSVARRLPARFGFAVVYHRIAPQPGDRIRELVPAMGLDLFEQQLKFLTRKLRPVRASELWDATQTRKPGQPFPVAITFDDDWTSHLEYAAPTLSREGATATFFLCGASLDEPGFFWWELLQHAIDSGVDVAALLDGAEPSAAIQALGTLFEHANPERRDQMSRRLIDAAGTPPRAGMNRDEIRALHASGVEIGFHTRRHDSLPDLTDAELHRALVDGREQLEQLVGRLEVVSYPHGAADARVAAAARAGGFELGYSTEIAAVTPATTRHLLGRLEPSMRSARALELQVALALLKAVRR